MNNTNKHKAMIKSQSALQESSVRLTVYDNPNHLNNGITFKICNQPNRQGAQRVVLQHGRIEYEATLGAYKVGTLRGCDSIKVFIETHNLQPGQSINCRFKNDNGTHRYIVSSI